MKPIAEMTKPEMREELLRARLTPEFMSTLEEACRIYGWSGDFSELIQFWRWLRHDVLRAPKTPADLWPFQPYEYGE